MVDRIHYQWTWCFLVLCTFSLAVMGCGERRPTLYHVSGTVTFGGKPVPAGSIIFEPDTSKGNQGPAGFAAIKNGRYDTRDAGRGTVGGPHVVRITGLDGVPAEELPQGTPLFPEYTTQIDLPKKELTQDFDVPTTGKSQKPAGSGPSGV
ncbi:MAG: hypothetical protein ACUVQG_06520 [Thermogutta sp.]